MLSGLGGRIFFLLTCRKLFGRAETLLLIRGEGETAREGRTSGSCNKACLAYCLGCWMSAAASLVFILVEQWRESSSLGDRKDPGSGKSAKEDPPAGSGSKSYLALSRLVSEMVNYTKST